MADHSKPTLSSAYTDFVTELDGRFDDLAAMMDPAVVTVTNPPTNSVRWNSALAKFQKYNGSSWVDLMTGGLNVPGAVSATGAISSSLAGGYGVNLSGASTGFRGVLLGNTGATTVLGVEGSSGGSFASFSPAYSTVLATFDTNPIIVAINNSEKGRFTTTGLSVTGTLSASGAATSASYASVFTGLGLQSFGASRFFLQAEDATNTRMYTCGPDASTYGVANFYVATSTGTPQAVWQASSAGLSVTGALSASTSVAAVGAGLNTGPVSAGTSHTFALVRNSGGDFFFGKEGSTAGGYFTGTAAYDDVIYSTSSINLIVNGVKRGVFGSTGLSVGGNVSVGAGDLQTTTGALRFDETSVRSWAINASSGNLNFGSGDGLGTFAFGSNIGLAGGKSVGSGFGQIIMTPGVQVGTATYAGLYGAALTYLAKIVGGVWKSTGGGNASALTIDEGIFSFARSNSVGAPDTNLVWNTILKADGSGLAVTGALSATASLGLNNGNTISFGGIGSDVYISGSSLGDYLEIVTGGVQRAILNSTGLTVTGALNATVQIESGDSLTIAKNGSDSIGAGAYYQVRNVAATRSWATQLSASNNLDWWHLNGSWSKYMTLSTTGLSISGGVLGVGQTPAGWGSYNILQVGISSFGNASAGVSTIISNNTFYDGEQFKYIQNGYASLFQTSGGEFYFSTYSNNASGANALLAGQGNLLFLRRTGELQFNSGYGSVATAYGCRAWVNFDGTTNTGGFCTIRSSGNVTSVADNGTGDYTVNFANGLVDANYSAVLSCAVNSTTAGLCSPMGAAPTTSALRLKTYGATMIATDCTYVHVAIHR